MRSQELNYEKAKILIRELNEKLASATDRANESEARLAKHVVKYVEQDEKTSPKQPKVSRCVKMRRVFSLWFHSYLGFNPN